MRSFIMRVTVVIILGGSISCQDSGEELTPFSADSASDNRGATDTEIDVDTDDDTDGDTDHDTADGSDTETEGDAPSTTDRDSESQACERDVIYVDAAKDGNGCSWENALGDLQTALAMAQDNTPAEVWVSTGVYSPGEATTDSFHLIENVDLYGGFCGGELSVDERDIEGCPTVLSGILRQHQADLSDAAWIDCGDEALYNDGFYARHVVTGAPRARLDGFTIREGFIPLSSDARGGAGMINIDCDDSLIVSRCTFTNNVFCQGMGGGMLNLSSSPRIEGCVFHGNWGRSWGDDDFTWGYGYGAAMALVEGSGPVIRETRFAENDGETGGAVYIDSGASPVFEDCVFSQNGATLAGAVYERDSTSEYRGCEFSGNLSAGPDEDGDGEGGAIVVTGGNTRIEDSRFVGNSAEYGGAILVDGNGSLTITNVFFEQNQARNSLGFNWEGLGGAVYADGSGLSPELKVVIVNSVFWANETADDPRSSGGAIALEGENVTLKLSNSTFYDNRSDQGSALAIIDTSVKEATIVNSIFDGHTEPVFVGDGIAIEYSRIQSETEGEGNLIDVPRFAAADEGDFHLTEGSACIDAADADEAPELDIEGNERVDAPDMGAFEYAG